MVHNGAKNAVIVGPARSLYGLVTALRKIHAPAGADQSKIPYSKCKNMFAMHFLVVNVPYHSDYLTSSDISQRQGRTYFLYFGSFTDATS